MANRDPVKKDKITLTEIKQDFIKLERYRISNHAAWRLGNIIVFAPIGFLIGIAISSPIAWLIISLFPLYHLVRFAVDCVQYSKRRNAIRLITRRDDVSISIEDFSHFATETIYEPHLVGTRLDVTKVVRKYYFKSGAEWREPFVRTHYEWSEDFCISSKGLEDISVSGDEFFYVLLQGYYDVAYIYPCKRFDLDIF